MAASAELARAVVLGLFAAVVAAGSATLVLLYGSAFLIGLGRTLTETTAQTILPQIVPKLSDRANGLLFSTETASEHARPSTRGSGPRCCARPSVLRWTGSPSRCPGPCSSSAVPAGVRALESEGGESLRRTIADGFQFVRTDRTLRLVTALIIGFAFCQAAATSTLVLYLTGPVGASEAGFGIVLALVAGQSIGGLVAGRVDCAFRIDQILLSAGLGSAVAFLLAGATTSLVVVAVALVVEGFLTVVGNVASISLRQRIVPDHLLGRVSGLLRSAIVGAYPLGAIAGGVLASSGELKTPLLAAAGLQLLVVALLVRPLVTAIWRDERLAH
ncbi:MAG: MFS transporter [Ilumatobacteraceae bacterium]